MAVRRPAREPNRLVPEVVPRCYRPAAMPRQRRPLSETRLRSFREGLIAERAQLAENVEGLDAEADVKNWRESGFDDDPADAGSASFERETAQSLSLHARSLLAQIDDAMRRLDDGTFGDCVTCGLRIELERLEALPYTTQCLDCRRREETGR
jgi:DnaK suppressor protein